tara:strand:+ start:255020 stop:260860 length:5841 start_codon:yes stop_codon:yes gene_type:complete
MSSKGFIKWASGPMPAEVVHLPKTDDWKYLNTSRVKVAGIDKTKDTDLGGFDLSAAVDEHPNHLFVKAFAIKADEVNDNGDAFSADELKKAAETFIDCPVFVNHQNDDVEKARGKVVHAWWDNDQQGIYVINRVDKEAYPQLARGIEEGYIVGTSMGAQVGHSVCSVCHNKAHVADEFCSHIKERKGKKYSGAHQCNYHKSPGAPKDDCPACGCKKGSNKELNHKEAQIFEWNYDINFIEDSFVVNPACHDCLVCDVLNVPEIEKVANVNIDKLRKVASAIQTAVDGGKIAKKAGTKEITALNEAMTLMEGVTRSMMAQKQLVSMEYVSDIVEQLAKLQETTDELVEMGYSQLPSPPESEVIFGNQQAASPVEGGATQVSDPNMMQSQQPQMSAGSPSGTTSSPVGDGLATITKPTFSKSEKEFLTQAENIKESIRRIASGFSADRGLIHSRRESVLKSEHTYAAENGDLKIVIAHTEDGECHVAEFKGTQLRKLTNADEFGNEMRMLIANDPQNAAQRILTQTSESKESREAMANSNNKKTAAGRGVTEEQTEMITQKQLDAADLPEYTKRQEDSYETITEGDEQIGGTERYNDVTTASPQTRRGSYDVITQEQLNAITEGHLSRWKDFPEVITEKQWDEMSRTVDAILPEDWTEEITQAQLLNLRDNHRWEDPNVITQGQLDNQGSTMPDIGDTARWKAAGRDPASLVKAAAKSVSDAIANYGLSPQDVANAVASVTTSPHAQMKASYLTLINAVPSKIAGRQAERDRRSYFERVANRRADGFSAVDGLLASMADNVGYLKSNNLIDAVRRIVQDKTAFAKAEKNARTAIKQAQSAEARPVSYDDGLAAALAEFVNEDGLTKVCGALSEISVKPSKGGDFVAAAFKFASEHEEIEDEVILASVDIDEEAGTFEVVLKDVSAATEEEVERFKQAQVANFGDKKAEPFGKKDKNEKGKEDADGKEDDADAEGCGTMAGSKGGQKTARSERRQQMLREAQLMGGQMPTDMGAGGGGGASLPAPPAEGGAPVESFDGGLDDMGEEGFDEDLMPKPPGAICPVCGSDDVDVVDGRGKCNNCGAEWDIEIMINVRKWPGITDQGEEDDTLGGEAGEEGEGFALDEDNPIEESLPVAATTRLTDFSLKKMAEANISLGSVSPYSGTTETYRVGKTADGATEFHCFSSGQRYLVRAAQKGDKVYARWEWTPRFSEPCQNCSRVRKTFAKALANRNLTMEKFQSLSARDRGKLILAMNNEGTFKTVKTASKNESISKTFKEVYAFGPGDKFPVESCREKLARRFGEDAIALSGPCHGSNLVDCVCKSLKSAGVYSNGLAVKIAQIWADRDGCIECFEDNIRSGFTAEQSSLICESMKQVFAQPIEMFADELENGFDDGGNDGGFDDGGDEVGFFEEDVNPFGGDEAAGFVTIELPIDVLEQVDEALDVALGEDPALEGHHDEGILPEGDVEVEVGDEVADGLEDATENALDAAVDVADEVVDSLEGEVEDDGDGDDDGGDDNGGGNPFGGDESHDDEGSDPLMAENHTGKKESYAETSNEDDSEDSEEEVTMREAEALADNLKRGKISQTGRISLDLDGVLAALGKNAQSNLHQTNVQDDADIQPTSGKNKSQMGHEDKLTLADPDAPSAGAGATMGKESGDLVPENNTNVPNGGGEMGHEADQGYTAEKGDQHTGGEDGAGTSKAASNGHKNYRTAERVGDLAESLIRVAEEKKLAPPAPHEDDEDIQPVQENKDHSHSGNEIKPREGDDGPDAPEQGNASFMGHEEESIGDVPKSPEHHPEFPAGGGQNSKYDRNERYAPEKQERDKGTVIARRDEESLAARKKAAQVLAGKMVASGLIQPAQIVDKIAQLERYQIEQIADLEKSIFGGASRKGLDAVAKGAQTPLVVNASANEREPAGELRTKLQSLFTLDRRNQLADSDDDAQLRNGYR